MYERNRQTELLVDINSMIYNYNEIKRNNPNKIILPILKASGYGIGIKNVKEFLDRTKIKYVGTAIVDEGVILRGELKYKGKIITLNQPLEEDINNIVEHNITVGVCYLDFLKKLNIVAKENNKTAKVHFEIETGMGRTGINLSGLESFLIESKNLNNIIIEGIYTHFATSDSNLEYTKEQIKIFNQAVEITKKQIQTIKYIHTSNSGAIINLNDIQENMIRPGIILYGYLPNSEIKTNLNLKPVCKLKSKISFIKEIDRNKSISYGSTFNTKRKSIIATIPIGYADGIKRALSNVGSVVINEKKFPIVGTICMDSFMVDITDNPNIKIGDEVYIWDNDIITVDEIAKQCETITYEILCTISNRVIRKLHFGDES